MNKRISKEELADLRSIQVDIDKLSLEMQNRVFEMLSKHDCLVRSHVICIDCGFINRTSDQKCSGCET